MSRLKGFISQLFATPDSPTASSDETLLARYREGEGAAFEILYARHRPSLYRFLLGLSGKPELADEVFQDTWLSLIRSTSQPQGRATFRTWLFQIARNRLIDHWRKHGAHQPLHDSYDEQLHAIGDETNDPELLLNLSRDSQRLESALQTLPAEQREVFLLRAHGDLDLAQIASLTETSLETVKSRLRYAQKKLRRLLAEEVLT
ncbi:RNA polymerase sigma factor [Pseudomonas koreensis]|uniref:RNA polymerase sigma factor n=1 Tax=Pseudomonas koreensis TaxID=198620 RepID=UPI002FCDD4E0